MVHGDVEHCNSMTKYDQHNKCQQLTKYTNQDFHHIGQYIVFKNIL